MEILHEALTLLLEDGTRLGGCGVTGGCAVAGEVVFTTAMSGYVEALTDPSYAGQILVFTYPLLGNYGVPAEPAEPFSRAGFQAARLQVQGVVVQHCSRHFSHHLADRSFIEWLRAADVPLLTGIDTRTLTRKLREHGTMRGCLFPASMSDEAARRTAREIEMREDVFRRVAPSEPVTYDGGHTRILFVDVGAKDGIVQCLRHAGAKLTRTPWHADWMPRAREFDGIVIANGPGDPADLGPLVERIKLLLERYAGPIFGICLGHQLLARAVGLNTYKLRYGHRGINQPVEDVSTGRCYVTSQNHGFAVEDRDLPSGWQQWFVNLNDRTNEGIRALDRPVFSVQFHPEGRPGPRDTEFLFEDFIQLAARLRASARGGR
jgi:carbamoyl-phosphate synthase small subunit